MQSEISQKEKDKYHILTLMYEIQKNSTDDPICRAVKGDTDIKNRLVDTVGEGEDVMI